MNWIKENKFLTGYLGVLLAAGGGLGFLLFSASAKYDASTASYEDLTKQLNGLQTRSPYPEAKNLDILKAQAREHQAAINTLQKGLVATGFPLEPVTPVQFQDKLKEAVGRVTAKAAEKGMVLPVKFYLGFDPYQFEPPHADAAPLLARELKSLELVVTTLIENRATALSKFDRAPLAEESGTKMAASKAAAAKPGDKNAPGKAMLVKRPFTLEFTTDQASFRGMLNALVSSKTQFFIPRQIVINNDKPKPLSKVETTPPIATPLVGPNGLPVPAPEAPADVIKYIVGEEKIVVSLSLEIVEFADSNTK